MEEEEDDEDSEEVLHKFRSQWEEEIQNKGIVMGAIPESDVINYKQFQAFPHLLGKESLPRGNYLSYLSHPMKTRLL